MLISRHLNAFTALTFIGLTGLTGAAVAAATLLAIRPERRRRHAGRLRLFQSLDLAGDDRERHL